MKHRYLNGVTTLEYNIDKCVGCGKCTEVCPHGVFEMALGAKASVFQRDSCMECGACALNCPTGSIEVDAGVGCAAAITLGWLRGKEPSCGCGGSECC
ncbi:MAG: 4Fe-4S dicluster domain-containing protein [Oscillospiraceae bacterium]|nr:4Fe-4S dicluster domain-containing protein [Oscillospiraceae bacterium]